MTVSRDELGRRMLDEVAKQRAPSVSVACVSGDEPVVVHAVGHTHLAPPRDAAPETAYPWFSVTKLFTATAVLQLVESGKVELDLPISNYVSFPTESARVPTVRQLLSHTSGLANPVPIRWVHLVTEPGPTLDVLTHRLLHGHRKLSFVPGTRFAYSNLNYLLLGQIIECVSGQSYETYVSEHVLRVLGAKATGFTLSPDAATGYSRPWSLMGFAARFVLDQRFFGSTVDGYTQLRPFLVDGAPYGGLVGPAAEMLLLGRAMLGRGTVEGRTLLQPETADLALSATKALDGRTLPIGLGWHLGSFRGEPYAFHLGGGGGFHSELRIYPRLKCAVAIIGNETSFDTTPLACFVVRRSRADLRAPSSA